MPNPDLLNLLDERREYYTQRARAVTALLGTFQNFNKAFAKAHKQLRDYSETPGAGDTARRALGILGEARLKESALDPLMPDLRRESKTLTHVTGALKDALAALGGDPVDVIRLDKAHKALQAARIQDEALSALLERLVIELVEAQNALANTFGAALRAAFVALDIEVSGRPPQMEAGRYEIGLNFLRRQAVLHYGKEPVGHAPLSVEGVLRAYQHADKAIAQRAEDGTAWMRQFHEAWEAARRGRSTDLRANVVDCYFELVMIRQKKAFRAAPSKSVFQDYSRAQFAFDLDRFVNRAQIEVKGLRPELHVAIKANTDNPEKSLWVVDGRGPHDGRYVGDVIFDRRD